MNDVWSAARLCELARHYAETGDSSFRTRLYDIVDQKPITDGPWLGEDALLQLDGASGFLFAARVRGKLLASHGWEWDYDSLVFNAIERFGEDQVNVLLSDIKDESIQSFLAAWRRQKELQATQERPVSYEDEMRACPASNVLSDAESNHPRLNLRRWGMHADEADLDLILQRLLSVQEPTVIARLLSVFSNRGVPRLDNRLIQLCQHGDSEVRRGAVSALEKIRHPLVREFAIAELLSRKRAGSVIGLFVKNYQPGDENRILEYVELPDDEYDLHGLLMDVIEVLKANSDADCSHLGVIAYASTPCEICRFHSAQLLLAQKVAPGWLTEECQFDSSERNRQLVAGVEGPAQSELL
jgi:hypothetical protein